MSGLGEPRQTQLAHAENTGLQRRLADIKGARTTCITSTQQREPKKHSNRYEHSTAQHNWHEPGGPAHLCRDEQANSKPQAARHTGLKKRRRTSREQEPHASQTCSKGSPKSIATDTSTQPLSTSGMRQKARYTTSKNCTTVTPCCCLKPSTQRVCVQQKHMDTPPTNRHLHSTPRTSCATGTQHHKHAAKEAQKA